MMTKEFKAIISGHDPVVLTLSGPMTEDTIFGGIDVPKDIDLIMDLQNVSVVTAIALRRFRNWSMDLQSSVIRIRHCPKNFIDQLNLVPGLLPQRAIVESFYVPFASDSGEEKQVLFRRGREFQMRGIEYHLEIPEIQDSRGEAMDMDVNERYFSFLKFYAGSLKG